MAGHGQDRLFYRKAGGGGLCRGQHGCCQFQRIQYCGRRHDLYRRRLLRPHCRNFGRHIDCGVCHLCAPLEEVESVAAVADPDSAVDGGKLILLHDGRKAKIARAVNSLTTVPEGQSPALKKIKVVEAIDLIRSYAIRLPEDRYGAGSPTATTTRWRW